MVEMDTILDLLLISVDHISDMVNILLNSQIIMEMQMQISEMKMKQQISVEVS